MRILMLEPAAGDEHARIDQRTDHRLVGIALLALVGDDALALEARRVLGEEAIGIDGEGDRLIPPELFSIQMSKSSAPWPGAVWTKPVPASSVT